MKIACISASHVPSTTANSIQAMKACQSLVQLGHSVVLLVPGEGSIQWEKLASFYGLQYSFEVRYLRARPRLQRYDFSVAAIKHAHKLRADLVYTWPVQAAVLGLSQGMPVILEMHGPPEGKFGPLLFRMFLRLAGRKRILTITQALGEILRHAYRLEAESAQLIVAPNGVDLERYQDLPQPQTARQSLGLTEALTARYTGHLYPGRGMPLLMGLAQRFPHMNFLWFGGIRLLPPNRWSMPCW